jgi:putative membrane protein
MLKRKVIAGALLIVGAFGLEYTAVAQQNSTMMSRPGSNRLSAADKQFMIQAAQGGMAEVQFARIANQKASSQTVRQYAQQMINDHTPANQELMSIAARKGVILPKTIGPQNQAIKRSLSQLSGTAFDRAYLRAAGVQSHTQQAALFQREAQQGRDPDVKAFAARVLPIVQGHLQMARADVNNVSGMGAMPMQGSGSGNGMNMMRPSTGQ